MEFLGDALFYVGAVGLFVGYIWLVVLAFHKSTVHGVACVLVAILLLYFVVNNLKRTWRPALLSAFSGAAMIYGWNLAKG